MGDNDATAGMETAGDGEIFIVGVGASAGGLEAIRDLCRNLPENAPAAYVIVQHLSPTHKSLLTTLVRRETHLEVEDLEEGVRPKANTIYVTPPNFNVIYKGGCLRLTEAESDSHGPKPSIDRFFLSTAESAASRAVGIILSGTGNDGAFGVQAIRGAGGITIAQDDKTAKYDGMPVAAVETGCIDLVLSPGEIGRHLGSVIASPRDLGRFRSEVRQGEDPLSELLTIVLAKTRVDFRDYKPSTIQRRLERRMTALGVDNQSDYLNICRSNPAEVDALFRDFLVSVTWFFRDPQEFEAVAPVLREIAERRDKEPARIWIAGCATGEEAYTIAILFAEALGGVEKLTKDRLQIFATDIDQNALAIAKKGVYSLAALDNVPPDFIEKYFTISESGAAVHPNLKDVVIVSNHNVCQDPPFINVDLICCRNLLIYFGAALQSRVLSRLNYALREDGMILLGTAESVSVSEDLFVRVAQTGHLYRKRQATLPRQMFRNSGLSTPGAASATQRKAQAEAAAQRDRAMFDSLARSLGSNSILASDDHRILQVYGDVGRYISMDENSQLDMTLSMLRQPLAQEARMLSSIALKSEKRRKGVPHTINSSKNERAQLEVFPIASPTNEERLALITISNWVEETRFDEDDDETRPGSNAYIDHLEKELSTTREALQQTLEELETSNEELQSSNEELQATNEELQAINEELETSNEELQSSNEELVTVNEELQISASELTMTNDELNSILQNLALPLLIMDSALQVTKASKEAVDLFGIKAVHSTPHLSQCSLPSGFPDLVDSANESLQLGKVRSQEFDTERGFFVMRCAPISNALGQLQGVTMTFSPVEGAPQSPPRLSSREDSAAAG